MTAPSPRSKTPWFVAAGCVLAVVALLLLTREDTVDTFSMFGRWSKKWIVVSGGLLWVALGAVAKASSRKALFRFLLSSLMLFAMWVVLEAVGLLGLVHYGAAFGTRNPGNGLGYHPVPHVEVEGETPGNIAEEWSLRDRPEYPFEFRTDHRGFRNPTDRDAADIYLAGDSFVVAGLVDFPETLAGRLEATLERPAMHVAVTGLSPAGARDLLFERPMGTPPLDFKDRLVIQFLFEGNDLRDMVWDRQKREDVKLPLKLRSFTVNLLDVLTRWSLPAGYDPGWDRAAEFGDQRYYFMEIYGWSPELEPQVPEVMKVLAEVKQRVEAEGGTYLVAMFPTKLRVLAPYATFPEGTQLADPEAVYGPQTERFAQECAAAGIPYLDLTPPLRAATAKGEQTFFTDDTHLDAHGLEVVSQALLEWEPVKAWLASHPRAGD
ncbi:MAG: hypothetical protein R3F62_30265 [Planctomycetota bacterium]